MRQDSRLSRTLHVLLHMTRHEGALTSEQIGKMLGTNSAVVRRTLAGLRESGLVSSEKGHRGGWTIARDAADVSLLDIYCALGRPRLFAIGNDNENPNCAVEAVVNEALADALTNVETILLDGFANVTLADLATEFDQRCIDAGFNKI